MTSDNIKPWPRPSPSQEYFENALVLTGDPQSALVATAIFVANGIESDIHSGDVEFVARRWGVKVDAIRQLRAVPTIRVRRPNSEIVFHLIIDDPGGVIDVPDSRCIARHLPNDRHPTLEEIRFAILACRK